MPAEPTRTDAADQKPADSNSPIVSEADVLHVAREHDGSLWLYEGCPRRVQTALHSRWESWPGQSCPSPMDRDRFPELVSGETIPFPWPLSR